MTAPDASSSEIIACVARGAAEVLGSRPTGCDWHRPLGHKAERVHSRQPQKPPFSTAGIGRTQSASDPANVPSYCRWPKLRVRRTCSGSNPCSKLDWLAHCETGWDSPQTDDQRLSQSQLLHQPRQQMSCVQTYSASHAKGSRRRLESWTSCESQNRGLPPLRLHKPAR